MPTPSISSPTREGTRQSARPSIILRLIGWIATLILMAIVAVAGLGFYWLHKAKEAGLNPYLMTKNRALAAAEVAVIRKGEVRLISTNDAAETMLVRDKKTGKTLTLKFDRAKKSMVEMEEHGKQAAPVAPVNSGTAEAKEPDGTAKSVNPANPPSWVAVYPGASLQNLVSADDNEKLTGSYTFTSTDAADKVLSYYSQQLTSDGMKLTTTASGTGDQIVTGSQENAGRTVQVTVSTISKGTQVGVTYEQKKEAATPAH